MPRENGKGPLGRGPVTGRGLGPCGRGLARRFSRGFRFWQRQPESKDDERERLKDELRFIVSEKAQVVTS